MEEAMARRAPTKSPRGSQDGRPPRPNRSRAALKTDFGSLEKPEQEVINVDAIAVVAALMQKLPDGGEEPIKVTPEELWQVIAAARDEHYKIRGLLVDDHYLTFHKNYYLFSWRQAEKFFSEVHKKLRARRNVVDGAAAMVGALRDQARSRTHASSEFMTEEDAYKFGTELLATREEEIRIFQQYPLLLNAWPSLGVHELTWKALGHRLEKGLKTSVLIDLHQAKLFLVQKIRQEGKTAAAACDEIRNRYAPLIKYINAGVLQVREVEGPLERTPGMVVADGVLVRKFEKSIYQRVRGSDGSADIELLHRHMESARPFDLDAFLLALAAALEPAPNHR